MTWLGNAVMTRRGTNLASGQAAYPDYRAELPSEDRPAIRLLLAEARFQTMLALKLYRSLHGGYPETSDALVPEILPRLPVDPVTGQPLLYRLEADGHFRLDSPGLTKSDSSRPDY